MINKEDLAAGQYRWVRVYENSPWEPASIESGFNGRLVYYVFSDEEEDYVEDCYEWGPLIIPPDED